MKEKRYRLITMPNAQCHVCIITNEKSGEITVELISYNTFVIRVVCDGFTCTMECTGTYSPTTSRHINRFTTEFFGENLYYDCKKIAGTLSNKVLQGDYVRNFVSRCIEYNNHGKPFKGYY